MKMRLDYLHLVCKRAVYTVPFSDFNYFFGEMGAGKSTIARLVDYCLGGGLDLTPALQSEFVAASLLVHIIDTPVLLQRAVHANQLIVQWGHGSELQQVSIPARVAAGEVLAGTGVEVLSDLLFHIAGIKPPKIRKSRVREDSDLGRLSFRDLLLYCYLDQDSIDSSFFHLEGGADFYRRVKSRSVLGYLLGYNQQKVAELEAEVEEVRLQKVAAQNASASLQASLSEAGIESTEDIHKRVQLLRGEQGQLEAAIRRLREETGVMKTHVTEELTDRARELSSEMRALGDAVEQVVKISEQNRRHRNELLSLSTKFQRVTAARAVLNGVEFLRCPRCTQQLPDRDAVMCRLCGQLDSEEPESEVTATESDLRGRLDELDELLKSQQEQLRLMRLREGRLLDDKRAVDSRLERELQDYDSTYLARALESERRLAAITEEVRFLGRMGTLPSRVDELVSSAFTLQGKEVALRQELRNARAAADGDLENVRVLGELFLDCLTRSKLKGFASDDVVDISSPHFLPSIMDRRSGDAAVTSFDTLGSGGKKTLFKCCFAVAVHRLAVRMKSILPTLLIIDSPMKNISERENRAQFEGFYEMLYELAETELEAVQFVMIDKEYCSPSVDRAIDPSWRHMTVDDEDAPPLIEYYRDRSTSVEEE